MTIEDLPGERGDLSLQAWWWSGGDRLWWFHCLSVSSSFGGMARYRRLCVPGSCYFFTVNLADRGSDSLIRNIGALRRALADTRARHPFIVDAWVVLPNHMHAVWTLPDGDADFSTRWASIKRFYSWQLPKGEERSRSRLAKRERGIWQRRFWEHRIRDDEDFSHHVDYVHFNPVKHGLVADPVDWPYSTYHRRAGIAVGSAGDRGGVP